jgi:hypothetical protein
MKKSKVIFSFVLLFMLVMFVSFASAEWWGDLFGKITGRVTGNESNESSGSCSDLCPSGALDCVGNGYRTCGDHDSDGCTEWGTEIVQCGSDATCAPLDGGCKSTTTVPCSDSDGGEVYGTKGTVSGTNSSGSYSEVDTCAGDKLSEWYCSDDLTSAWGGGYTVDCSTISGYDTCSAGACIQNSTSSSCSDSDSGKDYLTKGTVSGTNDTGSFSETDYCSAGGGSLIERYCYSQEEHSYAYVTCSVQYGSDYYCSDGACVTNSTDPCSDSDGGKDDFKTKGSASLTNSSGAYSKTDYCSGDWVVDQYCGNDYSIWTTSVRCSVEYGSDYFCSDGACVTNSTSSSSNDASSTTTTSPPTSVSTSSSTSGGTSFGGSTGTFDVTESIEELIEEGEKVIKEIRNFVDENGNEIDIESKVRVRNDGSSVREEERKFRDKRGNEVEIKVKTEITAEGLVITDEDRKFIKDGKEVKIKIKIESKNGNVKIKREIKVGDNSIDSKLELLQEFESGEIKLKANLSNGNSQDIKIMPDRASEIALEQLRIKGLVIELKEVGKGGDLSAVYVASGNETGRFLGLFKVKLKLEAQIDSESGEVIDVDRPWWAFLVRGDEHPESGIEVTISDEENDSIAVSNETGVTDYDNEGNQTGINNSV